MMTATWMWGLIGIVLLGLEMASGTFYILWFGVAALCLAASLLVMPNLPLAMQFFIYAVLSFGSLAIWKLYYKKTEKHSRVGQSQGEEIGRVGIVTKDTSPTHTGEISFVQGVMGSRQWVAVSNETIAVGASACIESVEGNVLRIKKV